MNFLFYGWSWRGPAALALTAVACLFMFVWFPAAARGSGSSDNKVKDLQLAYTPAMFGQVLLAWSAHRDNAVAIIKRDNIIRLDSLFPAVYGLALAMAYATFSGRSQPTSRDAVLFVVPLVAAVFDYTENLTHLYVLKGVNTLANVQAAISANTLNPSLIFFASACAYAKYLLLLVSAAGLGLAAVERIRR